MPDLHHLTALEQWLALQRGTVTPAELVDHYLQRIERMNPTLGAFVTITAADARERAVAVQSSVPSTRALWGLPIGDKDLVSRAGVPIGWGSAAFAGTVATTNDDIVTVLDEAGAISLGKTRTPEFGMYGYTEPLADAPTRNPWDPERGAGGSSGGAAAAVAAGLLPFAPGSDGGGSIRIPAAACGLVGLKPSRGTIPAASGITSLGGLAVGGTIARTVADSALLLDAMVARTNGRTPHRFTLRPPDDNDGDFLGAAVRGEGRFSVGVLRGHPWSTDYGVVVEDDALEAVDRTLGHLAAMGHGIEQHTLRHNGHYGSMFQRMWWASAAMIPVDDDHLDTLEPVTAELVRRGRALSGRSLAETQAEFFAFERSVIEQFQHVDVILTPSLAQTPRPIGWYSTSDADENFIQQVRYSPFTSFVNVAGLPAITLPISLTASGLPMGVQLIGRPGGENTLLALGAQLERRVRWYERTAPGFSSREGDTKAGY